MSSDRKKEIFVFALFALLIFLIHLPMEIVSDDLVNMEEQVMLSGLPKKWYFLFLFNGRFLTDGLAWFFYCVPYILWKMFDTVVWCILLVLIRRLFTDRSFRMLVVCAVLVLLFPILRYMASAGYIATMTNYIYTMTAMLIGITPVVKKVRKEMVSKKEIVLAALFLIYAENHDQTAMVAMGAFFLTGVLFFAEWKKNASEESRQSFRFCLRFLIYALIVYVLMYITPGHLYRIQIGDIYPYWLPGYETWPIWEKVWRGVATTFANLFFVQPVVFRVFCGLLIFLLLKNGAKKTAAALGFLLLGTAILEPDWFVIYYEYAVGMPDLHEIAYSPLGAIVSLCFFAVLILSVLQIRKADRDLGDRLFLLNILGFGSRFMMGLSSTLYLSSFRTFTAQLFCFIICDVLLAGKILGTMEMRGKTGE